MFVKVKVKTKTEYDHWPPETQKREGAVRKTSAAEMRQKSTKWTTVILWSILK